MKPRCCSPLSRILGMVQAPWNFSPFWSQGRLPTFSQSPTFQFDTLQDAAVFFKERMTLEICRVCKTGITTRIPESRGTSAFQDLLPLGTHRYTARSSCRADCSPPGRAPDPSDTRLNIGSPCSTASWEFLCSSRPRE